MTEPAIFRPSDGIARFSDVDAVYVGHINTMVMPVSHRVRIDRHTGTVHRERVDGQLRDLMRGLSRGDRRPRGSGDGTAILRSREFAGYDELGALTDH